MYSIAFTIHLVTIALLVPTILYTDHLGLSWFRGVRHVLPKRTLVTLHRVIATGLVVMILSGLVLFRDASAYLLITPAFYAKVGFILVLVINSFFIGSLMRIATEHPYSEVSDSVRRMLFLSGAASAIGWVGAIVSAFSLGL